MMLDLAEVLNPLLNDRAKRLEDGLEDDEDVADTTLQLVFFDGEEAFQDWTDTDSIYGARYISRIPKILSLLNGPKTLGKKMGVYVPSAQPKTPVIGPRNGIVRDRASHIA